MPGSGEPAILPRSDLTLHHAPPVTPARPHTITCPPLKEEGRGWANSLGRSKAFYDGSCWTEDTSPTMSSRQHTPLRSRDTWHGWSPVSRSQGFRSRSARSRDSRFSSTRSYDSRHYPIRSRASLNPSLRSRSSLRSVASRASSRLHRSLRRTGPLYRVASSRARAAREWAGTLRQQVTGKGGTLLLTPARGRRQPVMVATLGSPTPEPARNSPWVQATRRAASASPTIHWGVASGVAALFECGASAGSAAAAGVGRVCSAAAAMADGKLQQLRRSISSWSLSTVKKPKITIPKLKAPKIKAFRGKKNRVDPKDETAALEEVKAALLKAEGDGEGQGSGEAGGETSSEVIHEPLAGGSQDGQPTIVLTVHEHKNPPEPPSPPPSPGLLAVSDDLEFIDNDEADTNDKVIEAVRADADYSDQWFDACGTLTRSKEDMDDILNDLDDGQESKYYDIVDNTAPRQSEVGTPPKDKTMKGGSQRAREWVKNFDEKAESRIQKWLKMNKTKTSSNLPKSRSEVHLDSIEDTPKKWSKRDEIKLNTLSKDASPTTLLLSTDVKLREKEKQQSEKEKFARKESLKKIFQVRGKLSIKPIVDSQRPTYTDTDIHIAAAPFALANNSTTSQKEESLDVSEDGINCTSDDLGGVVDGAPTISTPKQHDNTSASSAPSSVAKQETSEATRESEAATVPSVSDKSHCVNDKQLGEGIVEKEAIKSNDACPPQSKDVPVQDSAEITMTDSSANQRKSEEEVAGDGTVCLPQSQDAPVQDSAAVPMTDSAAKQINSMEEDAGDSTACIPQSQDTAVGNNATDIINNSADHQAMLDVHDDGNERKPVEDLTNCPAIQSTETDAEHRIDLLQSPLKRNTSLCEHPEQGTKESCGQREKKEQSPTIQEERKGVEAVGSPKMETKETKKRKISGTYFPKSIRNFAESVFPPQGGGKGKTELKVNDGKEKKKKKKGRINPFNKESLFKISTKEKSESVREKCITPQNARDTGDGNKNEEAKPANKKDLNSFGKEEGNPFCDEAVNLSEKNNESVEAKTDSGAVDDAVEAKTDSGAVDDAVEAKTDSGAMGEDSTPRPATSGLPDILHSNGISSAGRTSSTSSVSLEFVSQIDSDEMKSVSHEPSPEMDSSFVEEDGLRLRKDALLAIKAMELDDSNTHYYSLRSTSEEFQTPMREDDDLEPTISTKVLPEATNEPNIQEAHSKAPPLQELQRQEEAPSERRRKESPQRLSESSSDRTFDKITNKTDAEKENLQRKVDELNKKNMEETASQNLTNGSSTIVPDASSRQASPPRCVPATQPPEEVPKLKLDPTASLEGQEAPKPSPRTKKGRYGYSRVAASSTPQGTTPSSRDPSISDNSENVTNDSSTKAMDNTLTATYSRGSSDTKEDPLKKHKPERTSSDSGYAGPPSNSIGGSDPEPIYWEISDSVEAPPKPSPRTKKNYRAAPQVMPNPVRGASSPPQAAVPIESPKKTLPGWINNRGPIPSPRGKMQRSLQSLPTVVPADSTMETVKKKLQLLSHEPLSDVVIPQSMSIAAKKQEDQFYSGKAASISYGFTPSRVAPPSPPLRGRKASQISLPAAMAAEESQCRQQKRTSLYVTPDAEATLQPLSPKRAKRLRNVESAVKRLGERAICLTELLAAAGLQMEATKEKTEELLADVLYSVHSLMGGTEGKWKVGGESDPSGPPTRAEVHVDQVVRMLQVAFQVSQETIDRLQAEVQSRPAPEVNLQLSIKEANDLRPKTIKGTTNPYVIVSVDSNGASHRTRLEKDTLRPKWNQEFTLPVGNLQKEVIRLEVWHEHDPVKMRQAITTVRDIKGIGRLVRGTTAQVQQQTSHLLGHVTVSVKDLTERGSDGWFMLEKNEERSKERGKIHLAGSVSSKAQLENKSRQSYDAFLARLVHHQLTATNNNNEQSEWSRSWEGHLSGPGAASLAQYAIMLDLSEAAIHLAWWKVGSRVSTADAVWVLSRLQEVQAAISKNLYKDEELLELRSSFCSFVRDHTERLKNLHKAYPPSSGVIARRQLTYMLKALQCMQNDAGTRALLDLEGLPPLHEMVTSSLATHAKNWWTSVIEELRGVRTTDEQITHVINIVKESHNFLHIADNTYNAIFMKEMSIPYMQTTYLMVSKKVNPCVRPLVMNIYRSLPMLTHQDDEEVEEAQSEYRLEVGTSLWDLYMNLGRLHQLSERLPPEAKAESGMQEYHRWFSRGVLRWLELAICRARSMIRRAVDLDMLETQDDYCKFSSSALDTLGIFNDVKIWWEKLAWPDPENSAVLLTKILEDMCSCVLSYSNLIREKVERIFHQHESSTRVFITEQICVGLNNIERVRTEMVNLPTQFGFQELLQKIRALGNGDSAAAQLEATVDRLIVNAAENTEGKVNEFIDTMLDKMQPTLERAVNEACEERSSVLAQVLDPSLELTINQLNTSNFKRFLWRLWEMVLEIFTATVMRNTERRRANYFGGVHSILEATLTFFSPPDGKGLDEKTAKTPAYESLMDLLESLRMSSESLIAKYYEERYEEQEKEILPCKARLYVKILFTKPGKLIVEVIMAKDMVVEGDACSINSRSAGLGLHATHQPVDSYMKVQLVPQEWFPAASIRKTKTQRKQDPAVYEETFEYDINKTDDGVRAGFLLLTLKDYNLGFSNTFIGEAVVPLAQLPCVDSSEVHTVNNTCLTMTSPGLDIGYKSLRALQFRPGDKVAYAFIKKVSKRLIEPKTKANTGQRCNEEGARSKSPNMRERLKLS